MNRRSFLCLSGLAAAALVLDPERALWVPGAKATFDLGARPAFDPLDGLLTRADFQSMFQVGDVFTLGSDPQRYVVTGVESHAVTLDRPIINQGLREIQKLRKVGTDARPWSDFTKNGVDEGVRALEQLQRVTHGKARALIDRRLREERRLRDQLSASYVYRPV